MSYCSASCTSVRSPLIAAIATFALKADVWFRRGLLLMLSPDSRANLARCQAEAPLIALCRFPKPALVYGFLAVPRHQMLNTIGNVALAFAIIWLGSTKGTEGSNRFGPDPIFRLAS